MATNIPDDMANTEAAATQAQSQRNWATAAKLWSACLVAAPDHARAFDWRSRLADSLRETGQNAEAEGEYIALAKARPGWAIGFAGQAMVAQQRRDWELAISRWDECLLRFPAHPAALNWRLARGHCLVEAGKLSEAETEFCALAAARPNDATVLSTHARIAHRRGEWSVAVERLDKCLSKFPTHASSAQWRVNRAVSLERLYDWPAAQEAWDGLVAIPAMRSRALAGRALCILERFGATDDAERAIEESLSCDPNGALALGYHARLATERSDHALAMTRWALFAERHPHAMVPYRNCAEAAFRCNDPGFATSLIDRAPPDLAGSIAFKCSVLLHHHRRWRETAQGLAIVQEIDRNTIDASSAVYVCQFLTELGLFKEAEDFAGQILPRFPLDEGLLSFYLEATLLGSGRPRFDEEKARLLAGLPDSVAVPVLARLKPASLASDDVKRVIDWAIASHMSEAKKVQQLLAVAYHPDPETLAYLAERLGEHDDVAFRLFGRFLLATVRDQHRLARANLGGVAWSQFEEEQDSLRRDTRELLASADAQRLPQRLLQAAARLERAGNRSAAAWTSTGESWFQAASLTAWLENRIAEGKPTSVIRLGDGEGNFLPYSAHDIAFQTEDQRQIQQVWWGAPRLSGAEIGDLGSRLEASIRHADAVALPPLKVLLKDLTNINIESSPCCRGQCSAVEFVESQPEAESKKRILLSLLFNSDLDRWDLFRQIFARISSVSVISCLDLSRFLAEHFGVGVRCWYRIPPEHRYRSILLEPGYEPERPFYPDLFEGIMADLAPRPGELFLVAAGFLGKILCDRIRERGGIGLDIGSQADSWMGRPTRFYTGAALEFDAASSLIEGQPFSDGFDASRISDAEPCRSDRTRRTNLTGRFDAVLEPPAAEVPQYALRVIGHPRCGSTYVAVVLSSLGLQIGHERPGADGVCSWIHAVEDLNPPFDALWLPPRAFRRTMAYVRDPATAIPSIMLENTTSASFDFRRFHIARILGVDIAARRDPLERALESYLRWTEIVDLQHPMLTMRVERLLEDINTHAEAFESLGFSIEPAAMAKAARVPSNVNTSQRKFALARPSIEAGRYTELPADLRDRLARFCERYGYPVPV